MLSEILQQPFIESRLDEIAALLANKSVVVLPNCCSLETCRMLVEELRELQAAGVFHPAAVGRGEQRQVRPEIRSDFTHWLDPQCDRPVSCYWLAEMDTLRNGLNQRLFLGLDDYEGHFALYPPGAFYGRHNDRFGGSNRRTVTCILYLNEEWKPEDGGQLRAYLPKGALIDIQPEAGTLVLFISADLEHEVLPAKRERLSLTGWFLRRE